MRTTLSIDDDILKAARALAEARCVSLGKALSDLARQGLYPREAIPETRNGIPIFITRPEAPPITLEDVKGLEDIP